MKRRKIKTLRLTSGQLYQVCKKDEFIHKHGCYDSVGLDECSIEYIGFGRYRIGYFDSYNVNSFIGQNRINKYITYFPSAILEIEYKIA